MQMRERGKNEGEIDWRKYKRTKRRHMMKDRWREEGRKWGGKIQVKVKVGSSGDTS